MAQLSGGGNEKCGSFGCFRAHWCAFSRSRTRPRRRNRFQSPRFPLRRLHPAPRQPPPNSRRGSCFTTVSTSISIIPAQEHRVDSIVQRPCSARNRPPQTHRHQGRNRPPRTRTSATPPRIRSKSAWRTSSLTRPSTSSGTTRCDRSRPRPCFPRAGSA